MLKESNSIQIMGEKFSGIENMSAKTKIQQQNQLPDGSVIDLNSYEWGEVSLTKREKLFIVWYTMPCQEAYMNSTLAAKKAGYSVKASYHAKYTLVNNPKIKTVIEKFMDQFIKVSIKDAARKALAMKIQRAEFDTKDFYKTEKFTLENGVEVERLQVIPIDEIESQKAALIDNIEINNQGIPTYKLPNREKEINEIIKLNENMNQEKSTGDYDVETTVDLIKQNLATVRTTVRLNNQITRENAENYIENSENQPDFD